MGAESGTDVGLSPALSRASYPTDAAGRGVQAGIGHTSELPFPY